jgi:hypothetical protein
LYLSQKKGGYLAAGVFNFWRKMLYLSFNGSIHENKEKAEDSYRSIRFNLAPGWGWHHPQEYLSAADKERNPVEL